MCMEAAARQKMWWGEPLPPRKSWERWGNPQASPEFKRWPLYMCLCWLFKRGINGSSLLACPPPKLVGAAQGCRKEPLGRRISMSRPSRPIDLLCSLRGHLQIFEIMTFVAGVLVIFKGFRRLAMMFWRHTLEATANIFNFRRDSRSKLQYSSFLEFPFLSLEPQILEFRSAES